MVNHEGVATLETQSGVEIQMTLNRQPEKETLENSNMKDQHSITKIIILHILPGMIITLAFVVLAPWAARQNLPAPLSLLLTWVFVGIPLELGILMYEGYRHNHRLSLKGVLLFKETIRRRTFFWLIPLLVIWVLIVLALLAPSANEILLNLFSWYPKQLILSNFAQNISKYPRLVLWLVFGLSGILNIVVPVIEELYFRGFLLPRMSTLNKWAPLVNTVLFSLYHFWLPWEFFNRIIALFPMTYAVWRTKNVFVSIWVHSLINTFGTIGLLVLILNQG